MGRVLDLGLGQVAVFLSVTRRSQPRDGVCRDQKSWPGDGVCRVQSLESGPVRKGL